MTPVFVVVGHANRGKSSIVSTLAADETVRIGATPGTTRKARSYPMRLDGETLYHLVDTPGFERARHVMAWLKERETETGARAKLVREFVEVHANDPRFEHECELLRPILEGGAVLYVVDASVPLSASAETEAEILRWTGRPRMALLNPIGDTDHGDEWRPVLDQYFSLVRRFDAHQADFARRLDLLRALRELSDDVRPALDRAVEALQADRADRAREAAGRVADAVVDLAVYVEEERLAPRADPEPAKAALADRFYDALREREARLAADLRSIYWHRNLEVESEAGASFEEDLFDTDTWSRLGLSRTQLLAAGFAAGAAAGFGIDLAVGGGSLLLGSLLGGAAGGASTWWAWDRLAEIDVLGESLGGVLLRAGPVRDPNFPWVVLDRALLLQHHVSHRAHAKRDPLRLAGLEGRTGRFPPAERKRVQSLFGRLRKRPAGAERRAVAAELAEMLVRWFQEDDAADTGPRAENP